jgi:hypothetical protein
VAADQVRASAQRSARGAVLERADLGELGPADEEPDREWDSDHADGQQDHCHQLPERGARQRTGPRQSETERLERSDPAPRVELAEGGRHRHGRTDGRDRGGQAADHQREQGGGHAVPAIEGYERTDRREVKQDPLDRGREQADRHEDHPMPMNVPASVQ